MHLDISVIAEIDALARIRQKRIDERLVRVNAQRINRDCQPGDKVFVCHLCEAKHKAGLVCTGPFEILRTHTNNAVTVQRRSGEG